MNLEAEKKLVAEKLMGWESDDGWWLNDKFALRFTSNGFENTWNPQDERKWWDEIWEKMDEAEFNKFIAHLLPLLFPTIFTARKASQITREVLIRRCLTAKPETCWKALIKTLEAP